MKALTLNYCESDHLPHMNLDLRLALRVLGVVADEFNICSHWTHWKNKEPGFAL